MKQHRLSDSQKIELCSLWETKKYTCTDMSLHFKVSITAISGLLKRRGYAMKSQTELQRKYPIDESFFDVIDTEEKAYFLGILYADGYNNTDRYSVNLSLKESDKEILVRLNNLIQPTKPLQYVVMKAANSQNQCRLVIANKHISLKLAEHGCGKAKTFVNTFPVWMKKGLICHFVRGYFDGDGHVGLTGNVPRCSLIATEDFCLLLAKHLKDTLSITTLIRTRHPERNHCIRELSVGGKRQIIKFLQYIYQDQTICLDRKFALYRSILSIKSNAVPAITTCQYCGKKNTQLRQMRCKRCYYQLKHVK